MFNFGEVDSLDAVPAEFRFAYNQQANANGKFTVSDAAKSMVTAYQGQATALEQERGKVRAANAENATRRAALKPYEDLVTEFGITPEDPNDLAGAIKAHVGTLQDKVKGGDAFKGNLAKIKEEADKRVKAIEDVDQSVDTIEVWEKDPSTQSFTDLMNRLLDKPSEHVEMEITGGDELLARLDRGRERARKS